jgi:two-component system cell cycle sensor histidine kinase/response regulator CckA
MIIPVVIVVCAVGLGFYFFVLRTLSEYAEQEIRSSLTRTGKDIYDICDRNFTALLQSGQMSNDKMVRIRRALTLGEIEDYAKRNNLLLVLREGDRPALITFDPDTPLANEITGRHQTGMGTHLTVDDKVYYFHHFNFKPWDWHIDLLSDMETFTPLIDRVKRVYALTAVVLLFGLSAMIIALDRAIRNPVRRIIAAVREKRPPDYQGIHEFEFLSRNIAGMMTSLEERTQWLERLYTIGTAYRGEAFFTAIAQAITEAMGLNTVITRANEAGSGFRIVAVAAAEGADLQMDALTDGLPCDLLIDRLEPTVVPRGAARQYAGYKGIVAHQAESYVGLPIAGREGSTIGCAHLFGPPRDLDDWGTNFVKTVGRMVGSEFALMEKEQEQERIREQMFRSQKLESLGLLAGGVAHDFNNLLMGIQGRANLALEKGMASTALGEHIRAIEEYVSRASELTGQLLGFARGGKYDVKPADLNAVLDHSAKMFGRTKKEIVIHTNFDEDLYTVEIDRRQMEQVFLNLFLNAWHAMPGGGELRLETANVLLDESFAERHGCNPGRFVKTSVVDTGSGMDAGTLKKIFDPFFTTREMGRGTGLGLAMVYGIIKNHDGLITVQSSVGRGTTFSVYLPASEKAVQQEPHLDEKILRGSETILLVDDEDMIVDVARAMLERLGYRVVTAGDGRQAVAVMEQEGDGIDLVILDLIMPGMNGGKVFDRLREIRPQVPVIMSSGYAIDGEAAAIMQRGCSGFIQKPFNMSDLSRKVREILDGPLDCTTQSLH